MSFGDGNLREKVADLNRQVDKLQRENGELQRQVRELQGAYDQAAGIAADLCRAFGFKMVDASGEVVS